MSILDSLLNKVVKAVKDKVGTAVDSAVDSVTDKVAETAADAVSDTVGSAVSGIAEAAKKRAEEKAKKEAEKTAEQLEAERKKAHEEAEHIAKALAELKGIPLDENAEESTGKKLRGGVEAFWQMLEERRDEEKNEGFVWTITINDAAVIDAMGLVNAKYELGLSASHVGYNMEGVYGGEMDFKFSADLSGLNAFLGAMGGVANTGKLGGWFKNDKFIMELTPYNKVKEDAFISTLDYTSDELGSIDDDPKPKPDLTDAYAKPFLDNMGSKPDEYEKANAPLSYWFDWEYNMTEGDMSQYYSVHGVMGIGSGWGSLSADGEHLEGHGSAVSPFGTFRDDISEDFHAPFPYVIHVYENGRVTFELHSQRGGGVVIIFRGKIDKIPVSDTILVGQD